MSGDPKRRTWCLTCDGGHRNLPGLCPDCGGIGTVPVEQPVPPSDHGCCGCDCYVCADGHQAGTPDRPHTVECSGGREPVPPSDERSVEEHYDRYDPAWQRGYEQGYDRCTADVVAWLERNNAARAWEVRRALGHGDHEGAAQEREEQ